MACLRALKICRGRTKPQLINFLRGETYVHRKSLYKCKWYFIHNSDAISGKYAHQIRCVRSASFRECPSITQGAQLPETVSFIHRTAFVARIIYPMYNHIDRIFDILLQWAHSLLVQTPARPGVASMFHGSACRLLQSICFVLYKGHYHRV